MKFPAIRMTAGPDLLGSLQKKSIEETAYADYR
jgi:hypothetical protein